MARRRVISPLQVALLPPAPAPAYRPPADWPDGRVYTPAEVAQLLPPPRAAPRHRACTLCGGYLQGTREATGECLNCTDGRGWAIQSVEIERAKLAARLARGAAMTKRAASTLSAARTETQRAQSRLVDRDRVISAQATLIEVLTDALLARQAARPDQGEAS